MNVREPQNNLPDLNASASSPSRSPSSSLSTLSSTSSSSSASSLPGAWLRAVFPGLAQHVTGNDAASTLAGEGEVADTVTGNDRATVMGVEDEVV
ncbi:hypothetical protein E4U53_002607, partial [Claviceps sorghi]